MSTMNFRFQPGYTEKLVEGQVALPVLAKEEGAETQIGGIEVLSTGLTADANGDIFVRPGQLVINSGAAWIVPANAAAIDAATKVMVLKGTYNLRGGKGYCAAFTKGTFYASRMPSLADRLVQNLEIGGRTSVTAKTFGFINFIESELP